MCACCLCMDINYIFILVIAGLRVYLSRGAHRYSSLLADFHVRKVPTHPIPFVRIFFSGGGGGTAGASRSAGRVARLC